MNTRGAYGNITVGRVTSTDKKALGLIAAIGGAIALIKLWPKAMERREQKKWERVRDRVRSWKQERP